MKRYKKIDSPEEARARLAAYEPEVKAPEGERAKRFLKKSGRVRRSLPEDFAGLIQYTGELFKEGPWRLFALDCSRAGTPGRMVGRAPDHENVVSWYSRMRLVPGVVLWSFNEETGAASYGQK
jgi:hypothetical protein